MVKWKLSGGAVPTTFFSPGESILSWNIDSSRAFRCFSLCVSFCFFCPLYCISLIFGYFQALLAAFLCIFLSCSLDIALLIFSAYSVDFPLVVIFLSPARVSSSSALVESCRSFHSLSRQPVSLPPHKFPLSSVVCFVSTLLSPRCTFNGGGAKRYLILSRKSAEIFFFCAISHSETISFST